jgi:hypothetical protein
VGVALGIATVVAVLGISSSSRAQLVAQIDALGTNLLTVAPGPVLRRAAGHAAGGRAVHGDPDRTGHRRVGHR